MPQVTADANDVEAGGDERRRVCAAGHGTIPAATYVTCTQTSRASSAGLAWRKTGARSDFSFTTRNLAELDAVPIALVPGDLDRLPDASIYVHCPEGIGGALSDLY